MTKASGDPGTPTLGAELLALIARRGGARRGHGAPEDLVAWANRAVAGGIDSLAVCILAGEGAPYHSTEVDDLFIDVLNELRLPEPTDADDVLNAEMLIVSGAVHRGEVEPMTAIDWASRVLIDGMYPPRFESWFNLIEDVSLMSYGERPVFTPGLNPSNVSAHLRRIAAETLRSHPQPEWLGPNLSLWVRVP